MKPVLIACLLCVVAHTANAQVYAGISAEGSIVLSSNEDETANTLLIEAEKIAIAVPAAAAIEPTLAWDSKIPAGFLPFIQEASATYQIPSALIHAVILVESNYNPRAYSSKGAATVGTPDRTFSRGASTYAGCLTTLVMTWN